LFLTCASLAIGATGCPSSGSNNASNAIAAMTLSSPDLAEGQSMPAPYVCSDDAHLGKSPPLAWSGAPAATTSFAVSVVDPDASGFVHWVLLNIPAATVALPAGASPGGALPSGAIETENDFGKTGYGGPCPPPGKTHHYVITVYALKDPAPQGSAGSALLAKLNSGAIAKGTITVTFAR
jgi:Raf kinase inhibitor-like YbhB/YbcL family protein